MKKTIYIFLFLLVIAGMNSCTKEFLELEPKTSQMESNFYKTESDAFLALVGVYDALSVQNWQFVPIMSDIFSDDAFGGGSDAGDMRQYHEIEQSRMDADNAAAEALWKRCYTGIYRANLLLSKLPGIEWKNESNKTRFEAEAKFLRAYFYWDLVRHYGWVPLVDKVYATVSDYNAIPQSTPDQVYKFIASDLLSALPGLPLQVTDAEKGRITKYAAEALMARIYLFYTGFAVPVLNTSAVWTDGITNIDKTYIQLALDDIITHGGYDLMPVYAQNFDWAHENNIESVFEWQYSEKAKSSDWGEGFGVNGNYSVIFYGIRNPKGDATWDPGWSFATVSWSLLNEFENGDPRKDASIFNADAGLTEYLKAFQNTGYFNKKWMPRNAYRATDGSVEHNYPVNYIDIRYADVLLMAAEVYLSDNSEKALGYFNKVRKRALGDAGAKLSITLDDIYHERRVELSGEGHRKWDLLRRGLTYTEQKINASFVVPGGITNAQDFTGRDFKSNTWGMFPIPAADIRNASSGVEQQYVPAYQ